MLRHNFVVMIAILLGGGLAGPAAGSSTDGLERVTQTLVAPPFLPAHKQTISGPPQIVQVRLVIEEKRIEVGPGASIWALTFNGSVPGPIIVVHEQDYVELTLVNPISSTLPHNIDFHASTGALGGGALTNVAPGQEVVLRFKATKPGVFVYHCAPGGVMVPLHVVSGMNGAIMVLPRDGLKDAPGKPVTYDRAYYIGEQDFYLPRDEAGEYKTYPSPPAGFGDMMKVMRTLTPTHVVFNGSVGALTGDNAWVLPCFHGYIQKGRSCGRRRVMASRRKFSDEYKREAVVNSWWTEKDATTRWLSRLQAK